MAICKRMPDPEDPDLTNQSDFQLLNALTGLVSKENSSQLKAIAWEIMRRYSSYLDKPKSTPSKGHNTTLGDARWGDSKRVEAIFGIKRGVLIRLQQSGQIKSTSLGVEKHTNDASRDARPKRLYDLVSIAEYLDSKE